MLAKNLKDVIVLVDKDRVKSGLYAIREMKADTLLLDDGLQYLHLKHRLDIVLIDRQAPFGNEYLLPRGTLREPPRNLRRASYIFITKSTGEPNDELIARIRRYNRTAEIIECAHQPLYLQDVYTGEQLPLERLTDTYIGSFCGIAAPESFEDGLRKLGARIELAKRFTDHHRYTEAELQSFINRCIRRDVDMIVTTEKDAVRFPRLTKPEVPIYFLRVEILILSGHETWEHCVGAHLPATADALAGAILLVRVRRTEPRAADSESLTPVSAFNLSEHRMSKKAELIVEGRKLAVSNLDKVLWPKAGFTKGEMIDYYIQIAPVLLPHLKDRPLTMKRYPNGVEAEFFYEKNCPTHRPNWVKTAKVWSEGNQRDMQYCLAQDLPTLVWAANLADIELHTSLSRKKDVARPTMMVFDLDPGAPADIVQCCQVGLWLREILRGDEVEKLGQNFRLKRSAGLCAAQYPGHLRPDERTLPRARRASRARASRSWSFRRWRRRCAKEKSSSTGARTTNTRRRSTFTPCARRSSRPPRRR